MEATLTPPSPRFIARWDLDKTYLRTDFETLRDLVRTALERPDQKRTVPGAASLLRELSSAGGLIHILSGSPRQMRARIEEKLRLDGARFDSLTLKPNLENVLRLRLRALRDQLGYKLPALLRSRVEGGVALPEVLLGDDAEADAFVYSLYADVCAGLVPEDSLAQVLTRGRAYEDNITEALRYARQVPRAPTVRRILIHLERQSSPSQFVAYGCRVVPFYNYLQAALVLAEDDLLPPAGVVRVAAEMVLDHRFDADGLARSYLELRRRGCVRGDLGPALRQALDQLSRDARPPALDEVGAMCDLLDQQLGAIDPPPPRPEAPRDYLYLVEHHNPRRVRKKLAQQAPQPRPELGRRQRPDLLGHRLPLVEAHQQGDAPGSIFGRPAGVVVDVELGDQQTAVVSLGGLFEGGGDHPAGAAPGGPEIDHHRHRRLGDQTLEFVVRNVERGVRFW